MRTTRHKTRRNTRHQSPTATDARHGHWLTMNSEYGTIPNTTRYTANADEMNFATINGSSSIRLYTKHEVILIAHIKVSRELKINSHHSFRV
jgi:hypothetical protein